MVFCRNTIEQVFIHNRNMSLEGLASGKFKIDVMANSVSEATVLYFSVGASG